MSSLYTMSLVYVLTLLFVSRTLSQDYIYRNGSCPPGYFNNLRFDNGTYSCKKCSEGYFMDKNNTATSCMRCVSCGRTMVSKGCTPEKDAQCVCKERHYKKNEKDFKCSSCEKDCQRKDCKIPECRTTTATTTTTTTTTATTAKEKNVTSPQVVPPADLNPVVWMLLLIPLVPLIYCVAVLLLKNLYKYLHLCPRWKNKQNAEATPQTVTDQGCLQSRTTLSFTISEETPMMEVMSPVPPKYPAHSALQLPEWEHTVRPDQDLSEPFPAIVMYEVIKEVPLRRWKEFLRLLSVADQQLERVELDVGSSSMERQYQQLRLWSQKPSAKMEDIYSALHYMQLTGCAEMIMESLEKLHWNQQSSAV